MKRSIVLNNNIKKTFEKPSLEKTNTLEKKKGQFDSPQFINSPKPLKKFVKRGFPKKNKQKIPHGKRLKRKPLPIIFIQSTLNNTILTLTDKKGNPLAWSSAGKHGFKHSRKKTGYAAQVAATHLAKKCLDKRIRMLEVRMKGLGKGKRTAVSTIKKAGLKIKRVIELTPVPFNGCRPPKKRRK
jgi:small subunit ribosomal protein S11